MIEPTVIARALLSVSHSHSGEEVAFQWIVIDAQRLILELGDKFSNERILMADGVEATQPFATIGYRIGSA